MTVGKYYRFEWTIDSADGRRIVDGNVGFCAQSPEQAREFADRLFSSIELKDGCVWTYNLTCGGDE